MPKRKKFILLSFSLLVFAFILYFSNKNILLAQESGWSINSEELEIAIPKPTISNPKKIVTKNIHPKKVYEDRPTNTLSFSTSGYLLDFGQLTATNPVYRTINLNVISTYLSYTVYTSEDHPLTITGSNIIIPDTSCDNGSCTQITTAIWENTLTYGFGYRCDNITGQACNKAFNHPNYYKQFSDRSKQEEPQSILIVDKATSKTESQVTHKINISKTQAQGSYSNTIEFLVLPGY